MSSLAAKSKGPAPHALAKVPPKASPLPKAPPKPPGHMREEAPPKPKGIFFLPKASPGAVAKRQMRATEDAYGGAEGGTTIPPLPWSPKALVMETLPAPAPRPQSVVIEPVLKLPPPPPPPPPMKSPQPPPLLMEPALKSPPAKPPDAVPTLPCSHYYLRSLSWTSRTFYFLDSRDLLEVLRDFLGRERGGGSLGDPPGR